MRSRPSAPKAGRACNALRLIDTASAPIFGIDTNGKVTTWNAKASNLLGYSKDEALGQGLVQRSITEDYKTSVDEVLASALLGKETATLSSPCSPVRRAPRYPAECYHAQWSK